MAVSPRVERAATGVVLQIEGHANSDALNRFSISIPTPPNVVARAVSMPSITPLLLAPLHSSPITKIGNVAAASVPKP
jgi:hypothetical protein